MANQQLERVYDGLQKFINTLVGARGKGRHPVKTLLNGTLLGHPLHPVITDIAIGGAVLAAAGDIAWLAIPVTTVWTPRAAEAAVIAGILGMLGSFATGWTDWSDTYGRERTTGIVHGTLNSIALILYIVSAVLRLLNPTGQSVPAAILGFVGLGFITLAAYYGGDLVFKLGVNVNHTAWEHGTDDFVPVGALADVADNQLTRVVADGVPVVLVRHGDKIAALAATCTHAGGPLDEGELLPNDVVKCPWHGSRFRMNNGRVVDGPATVPQPVYVVRVENGQVAVKRR
jgi:nitrite reductase/ring-hydroxylating ferredoxin subunit/uncharacterized membrane protein